MNRRKEYILIAVINVVFAICTRVFLGSMLYISLIEIDGTTYSAMIGWFLYGSSLCMVLLCGKKELQVWNKLFLSAAVCGVLIVVVRAAFDYISDQFIWSVWSSCKIACISGVLSDIFGVFLTVVLFLLFVKGKKKWTKLVLKPILWILVDILIYAGSLIGVYSEIDQMTKLIGTTEENIYKIDYYFAYGFILPINVWTYTFLMIILWWLMRSLYVQEDVEEITDGNITDIS